MRIRFVLVTATAAALLAGRPALANGRFPASNQIVFSPTNDNIIVGRATYAILPSNDNGKTWGYLCEEALALPTATNFEDPEIGLTANNSIVAGLFEPARGLDVSHDLGCNWDCIQGPLAHQQIADVVVRPDMPPHRVLALTGTSADGGIAAQVYQSTDDGTTWAALGTAINLPDPDATASVSTIDVAASDPMRIYVSANSGFSIGRKASLFVSMDDGATWVERPVPDFNPLVPCTDAPAMMCQSEAQLFVAAVDPTNADIVYLRSNGPANTPTLGDSRLYVTKDAGQTFQVAMDFQLVPSATSSDYIQTGEMLGFALSPDGSKVFIGTKESGLLSASSADLMFTNINPKLHVQCLAARKTMAGQDELWACADEVSGFVFGKSTDDGVTFTPMMTTVTSMSGLIACSGTPPTSNACATDANASACSCSGYQMFCSGIEPINACTGCGQDGGGPPPVDTDAGVAAEDAGGTKAPAAHNSSCGCSVVGGGGAAGLFAGCAIAAVALGRRRKR